MKEQKTILLKIDNDVIEELRSQLQTKQLTGELCGLFDEFIMKLIKDLDNNTKEQVIFLRKNCQ